MYNSRVMNFNHILCQDISLYNYAYVFDSNAYISYCYDTFYRISGQLNNFGLQKKNLALFASIMDIQNYNNTSVNNNLVTLTTHEPTNFSKTEKQFFL